MVPITLAPNVRLVETRHGSLFVLTTDNSVGRALVNYGEWTFGEIELVRKFLRRASMSSTSAPTSELMQSLWPRPWATKAK